jgi:ComF family protein
VDERRIAGARRLLREFGQAALAALAPPACAACGAWTGAGRCCPPCRARLEVLPWDGCPRCASILDPIAGRCRTDHAVLRGIAIRRAAWRYAGTGGAIVRRFKFDGDPAAGRAIVAAAADRIRGYCRSEGRRAVLVHVPVHPRKRRRRGFDQAARIAEGVARALGRRFEPGVLLRVVETLPQGDPRVTSRARNVEGAFRLARPRAVAGRTLILVDDVSTSGATARECARVLRAGGAAEIVLLTAALG